MKRSVSAAWCSLQLLVDDRRRPGAIIGAASRPRASRAVANSAGTRKLTCSPSTRRATLTPIDVAFLVERRAAAHAGGERAAEEDLRIEAAPHQAVVGALRDREADVERVAERVDALALRPAAGSPGGSAARRSCARRGVAGAQQREVVQHVDLQDLQRRLAAVGGHVDEVVALGLQRGLADDVEVGDDVALAR